MKTVALDWVLSRVFNVSGSKKNRKKTTNQFLPSVGNCLGAGRGTGIDLFLFI